MSLIVIAHTFLKIIKQQFSLSVLPSSLQLSGLWDVTGISNLAALSFVLISETWIRVIDIYYPVSPHQGKKLPPHSTRVNMLEQHSQPSFYWRLKSRDREQLQKYKHKNKRVRRGWPPSLLFLSVLQPINSHPSSTSGLLSNKAICNMQVT